MAARLQMDGVSKAFGATVALDNVSLSVASGEVLALVGENGAGKSTLMKILAGACTPDAGQMRLDGLSYVPADPLAARRAGVGMIYQELALAPHLSVMENILLGMEPTIGPFLRRGEIKARAAAALAQVGRPDLPLERPVARLSIAERQLVEIARSVAVGCKVLILDEPTSSLAAGDIEALFRLIRRLRADGHAIIYISHFLEEVKAVADRYEVLRDGRNAGGGDVASATPAQIVARMVGRDLSELYRRQPRPPGEPILEITGLSGAAKPKDASLTLRRGEIVGIAGVVGAGRTELLRTVFGLDAVTAGRVTVKTIAGPFSPGRAWSSGMGLVSEDRKLEGLATQLSIMDNITLPKLPFWTTGGRRAAASRPWIDQLQLKCTGPEQMIARLSGGNQQKAALARLLHAQCDVLLLDEPTRGIDVGAKARIYALIEELAGGGRAVLVVSSYLPELLGLCDHIAVMCRGHLGPARPVEELNERTIMTEAVGGDLVVVADRE